MTSLWHELAGGTVGGVIGMTVVYPLDTVKSRLQTSGQARYSGMTHVLTSMTRKEGVMSLYRGLLSPVAGCGALFAISFSSYGLAWRYLLRRRGVDERAGVQELTLLEMSASGTFAGIVNSPFRTVFERIKGVMQVRRGKERTSPYSWSGACAADLVRREGVRMGLFRGMVSTTLREAVQCGVYYPAYALAKGYLLPPDRKGTSVPEPILLMIAGGLAGCATWVPPMYSMDVLKTRMQTAEPGAYRNLRDCAVKTWRAEGLPVLFRGLGPALIRAFPMHGLVFLGYESTIAFLDARPRLGTPTHPDVLRENALLRTSTRPNEGSPP